jgi:hypothetical protein
MRKRFITLSSWQIIFGCPQARVRMLEHVSFMGDKKCVLVFGGK